MQYLRLFQASLALRGEDIPEPQCFVTCASHNGASIGTHRKVENSVGVAGEGGDSLHLRVLPDIDLVERVAVGAHEFVEGSAEG